MTRSKTFFSLLTLVCLLSFSSCLQKTVSNKSTDSQNNTSDYGNNGNNGGDRGDGGNNYDGGGSSGGGQGYGDGTEEGISDAGQDIEYYTVSNITLKKPIQNGLYWSSLSNFPSQNRHIFSTDARFNLRVIARSGPERGKTAADGSECNYYAVDYDKLSVDICVRSQTGSCTGATSFNDIPVNQASKVKEFNVPVTSDPLVVEIKSVSWDYWCKQYKSMGYSESDPQVAAFCPSSAINQADCVRLDFQFSTDDTKDVPGPRL